MARPSTRAAVGAVLALCASLAAPGALASSHREAPFIISQPLVDGTDLYMFRSYEPNRSEFVTLIANYVPFQDPFGGPNYYPFDENGLYEIHIDNNGDSRADLTFQFRFRVSTKGAALSVGGQSVPLPLIISGPLAGAGVNPANLNRRETYTVELVRGDRRSGTRAGNLTNLSGGGTEFDKPVAFIGTKTFGDAAGYESYANQHIYNVAIPGCSAGRMFVGQRKEPFYIAVGEIFDLINLDPIGSPTAQPNDLEFKNINTLALEVPIACLVAGDAVIGAWTTSSLRQGRLIDPAPPTAITNAVRAGGAWTQVSRLGMPLVNEVVIGLPAKNRFNSSKPRDDAQFLQYVTHPTLPALIQSLFPVQAPNFFPRTDLVAAFLTGLAGLNRPANVVPSEMMRLNTTTAPTPIAMQDPLGVLAGDLAGFPNGRRPLDDVVDISLRVAMGVLCGATGPSDALGVGCTAAQAPSGSLAYVDGVRKDATAYKPVFPYLNLPIPGSANN